MSENRLSSQELCALVRRVFRPGPGEDALAIITDLPDALVPDQPAWRARRELARAWAGALDEARAELGLAVRLYLYANVRTNNGDLPATAWRFEGGELPADCEEAGRLAIEPMEDLLAVHPLVLAPTEFSATAPLKVLAKRLRFRAATMPGFSPAMVPALRLDYVEVNRRVQALKRLLDAAQGADLVFLVDGSEEHRLHLDLRHRTAHASGGLITEPGTAGNLPSGEAYIVPYEGEMHGDPSASAGALPVQLGDEVVVYWVERNRAGGVLSIGLASDREQELLLAEPAYGNLAELGLGVLADLGIAPVGQILLDEKLGLHIAFGRSEHFGGQVGPPQFSRPEAVVHIDRVYVPASQPRVLVRSLELALDDGSRLLLMRDGRYAITL